MQRPQAPRVSRLSSKVRRCAAPGMGHDQITDWARRNGCPDPREMRAEGTTELVCIHVPRGPGRHVAA